MTKVPMTVSGEAALRQELENLKNEMAAGKAHPMEVKHSLAREIVQRYHGDKMAAAAQEGWVKQFSQRENPEEMAVFSLGGETKWIAHIMTASGVVSSTSEAMRLTASGAVSIDGEKITDKKLELAPGPDRIMKIGKRRFLKITG